MKVLVTGGAGYIGTHLSLVLLEAGFDVCVIDNLTNGSRTALGRVRQLTRRKLPFTKLDLLDSAALEAYLSRENFDAVFHLAGLKSVKDSLEDPLLYTENNIGGTLNLLKAMIASGTSKIVFSSSATVYRENEPMPLSEGSRVSPKTPYGASKLYIEQLLRVLCDSQPGWRAVILRYFNPVGAHPSGEIGESPQGVPNNLMPYLAQVAVGKREFLPIFGADYPTPDGTGVRDYVHVMDIAEGHLAALNYLQSGPFYQEFNLGTGKPYTVLELVAAFEQATGKRIPYRLLERRPGDHAICYADARKAKYLLGWSVKRNIMDMCRDMWNWQKKNPHGYGDEAD